MSRPRPALRLLVTVFVLACSALASAQPDPRVLLISAHSASARLRKDAGQAIEQAATLIDPQRYARACSRAGLQPDSVEALERVAPSLHAQLWVLIAARGQSVRVSLRQPGSGGQTLRDLKLRLHRGGLASPERAQLAAAIRQALAELAPPEPQAAAEPSPSAQPELAVAAVGAAEPSDMPASEAAPEPTPASESPPPTAAADDAPTVEEQPPDTTVDREPSPLVAALAAGAGIGQRQVRLPTRSGEHRLDSGMFPALDVLVTGELVAGGHWLLGGQAHYQTSLGVDATTTPANGETQQTPIRIHHLDLGLTAGVRFADSEAAVSLRLFAGWAFRGLRPVVDIAIPAYTLHGPVLRPELRIPIAGGALVLWIAPELFFVVHVSSDVVHAGSTASSGLAFGGELAVDVRLSRRFFLTASYRESHASLNSSWSSSMTDVERFGTVRLGLRY